MYAINYFLVIPVRAYILRTYRQLNTPGCGTGAYSIAVRTILFIDLPAVPSRVYTVYSMDYGTVQ